MMCEYYDFSFHWTVSTRPSVTFDPKHDQHVRCNSDLSQWCLPKAMFTSGSVFESDIRACVPFLIQYKRNTTWKKSDRRQWISKYVSCGPPVLAIGCNMYFQVLINLGERRFPMLRLQSDGDDRKGTSICQAQILRDTRRFRIMRVPTVRTIIEY